MSEDDIKATLIRLEGKIDKLTDGDGTSTNPGYAGEMALLKARIATLEGHWAKIWVLITIPIGALITIAITTIFGNK